MSKRAFDLVVSFTALILFAPLMLVLALVVRIALGAPVVFCQLRPGRWGRPFILRKFRTMRKESRVSSAETDAERLPPLGLLLRRTSLDELPELWNVLRGEMSLVGPRPLLPEYLPLYSPKQARRHEVRPGITGWAQVNGRNAITWEERFDLDVWYVDHQGFWLDLKILWFTVLTVLRREGVSQAGHATMEKFRGSPQ